MRRLPFVAAALCATALFAGDLFAQSCEPVPEGAVAWWSFDETEGTTSADRIGEHHGAHTNGAAPAVGHVRGAISFDGSNDYIVCPDSAAWQFGSGEFTIELWANWSSPGGGSVGHPGDIFVGNDEGPGTRDKWFFALGGGVLNFHVNGPGIGSHFLSQAPFSPQVGRWYHLAVRRVGNTFSIFVDGELRASQTRTVFIPDANAPLTIGQAENLGFMNGRLDELTIYDRALTDVEVLALYQATGAGKCLSLTVRPAIGGNTGTVTVSVSGQEFEPGSGVRLTGDGLPDVEADLVMLDPTSTVLQARFPLEGAPVGTRNVVIDGSSGLGAEIPDGFEVVAGSPPHLWADLVGLNLILAGGEQTLWVMYGNEGNTDVWGGYVFVQVPAGIEYKLADNDEYTVRDEIGVEQLLFSRLAAGETRAIPLRVRAPLSGEIPFRVAIAQDQQTVFEIEDRFEPYFDIAAPAASPDSIDTGINLGSMPDLVGRGDIGGPGYVHYYKVTRLSDGHMETQVGIALPAPLEGRIGWSLPGIGVTSFAFAPSGQFQGSDGGWMYEHLFGIRPLPESEMPSFVDSLPDRFNDLNGLPYCNPGDPTANPPKVSCVGFVARMLFGNGPWPPEAFAPCPYSPSGCVSTTSFLQYLLESLGYNRDMLIAFLDSLELPPWARDFILHIIGSWDPNDKGGSLGATADHYVACREPMRYTIRFENEDTATAPAHVVVIEDDLDEAVLDLVSLSLGIMSFGDRIIIPPPGVSEYQTEVDLRPAEELLVRIEVTLDQDTGLLRWRFVSIDPATGEPPADPLAGFLPPNQNPPEGEGAVVFSILPQPGLSTGAQIDNESTILFDFNPPIVTNTWSNRLDCENPLSQVMRLPFQQMSTPFRVKWTGHDQGSGIGSYSVFVSADGGPFEAWLTDVAEEHGDFPGQPGSIYRFYSIARDRTGNLEPKAAVPEATTKVSLHASDQRTNTP